MWIYLKNWSLLVEKFLDFVHFRGLLNQFLIHFWWALPGLRIVEINIEVFWDTHSRTSDPEVYFRRVHLGFEFLIFFRYFFRISSGGKYLKNQKKKMLCYNSGAKFVKFWNIYVESPGIKLCFFNIFPSCWEQTMWIYKKAISGSHLAEKGVFFNIFPIIPEWKSGF